MDCLAEKLFDIQAVKFGSYTLKSGLISPIYFDLRVIVSHPTILEMVSSLLWDICEDKSSVDLICGVPYTALPIASLMSVANKIPMIMKRKEAKEYGTKKLIEGEYSSGKKCLIVEDVVTSGSSVLETAIELRKVGLEVNNCVVLIDRLQGGKENLSKHGVQLKSIYTIEEFMCSLEKQGKVDKKVTEEVMNFVKGNAQTTATKNPRINLSLEQRRITCKHPIATRLFSLMMSKQSNLCLAADLPTLDEVIKVADIVGPKIVVLKLHVDIFDDFTEEKMNHLKNISRAHQFLIMEDRKFADIANTVQKQFHSGIYKISSWADMVTAHALPGPHMITHMFGDRGEFRETCGCVVILEMSTNKALTTAQYAEEAVKLALEAPDLVMGFVGQSLPSEDYPGWLQFTPGVSMKSSMDSKGQQYCSPAKAILQRGADIIIVGRGLLESSSLADTAESYRFESWNTLMQRSGSQSTHWGC